MGKLSSLLVEIGVDITGLEIGGRKASKSMEDLATRARKTATDISKLAIAATSAGTALLTAFVKTGLDAVDAQAKLARSLDTNVNSLRALQLAASGAGVDADQFTASLTKMNAMLGAAQRGSGGALDALKRLGLSARELAAMPADERMAALADRMKALGLSSSQAANELRELGFKNQQMIEFMRGGGDAIRKARDDVRAFSIELSNIDTTKVEMAKDALDRLKLTYESIRNTLVIALAPLIEALAEKFSTLARENKGFGAQVLIAVEGAVTGFGKFLDLLHGIRMAFKTLQLAAAGMATGIITSFEFIMTAFTGVLDDIARRANAFYGWMNKYAGFKIPPLELPGQSAYITGLHDTAAATRKYMGEVREELEFLGRMDPNQYSKGVKAFFDDVNASMQARAAAAAAAQQAGGGGGSNYQPADAEAEKAHDALSKDISDFVSGLSQQSDAAISSEREKNQLILAEKAAHVEQISQMLAERGQTEAEIEQELFEQRMAQLAEAHDLELMGESEFQYLKEQLEQDHWGRMGKIRERSMSELEKFTRLSYKNQAKTIFAELANITAGVAQENKTLFNINKAAGIATALINAYEGISLTLSKYPYPINLAMAAAHAVSAFAQVNAIRSQSFGSGGAAAPSLAGSTPATPVTPVGTGAPGGLGGTLLTIEGLDPGSLFSGRAVRELAERLEEHLRDGGRVQFAGG